MRKSLRIALTAGGLATGALLSGSTAASAQVAFEGRFPLPHGRLSVSVGDPFFRIGAPVPLDCDIFPRTGYGYGFYRDSYWYPVHRLHRRWLFAGSPLFLPGFRGHRHSYQRGHAFRSYDRFFRHQDRSFRDYGRSFGGRSKGHFRPNHFVGGHSWARGSRHRH